MPLNLPAVPNFQTNIPQVDPLQTYGKMLQLKALQGQQQLIPGQLQMQQQQIQASQTENELKQLQLQSQKGVAAYWSDPSKYDTDPGDSQHNDAIANMLGISPTDPLMAHVRGMLKAGAGPAALVEAKNTLQVRQEWSKATQEQQAVLKNAFEQLREIAAPVMNEHDATKKQALLDSALPGLQRWASFDPSLAQVIPQLHAGNFDAFANRVGAEEKALGLTKTQLENTVQAQKVIPGPGQLSPEMQAEAKKQISVETDPAVIKARADAQALVAKTVEPLRLQIQQQFGNQKDARDKIETTVLKPYQEKLSEIGELRGTIDQAAAGNIASARAALYKTIGVAQPAGTHRVAPTEVTGFSGMGSIPERIKGSIANALSGDPWTPQMVQDIKAFADGQEKVAQDNLKRGIGNTNKLYNTNVGTGLLEPDAAQNDPFKQFGGKAR